MKFTPSLVRSNFPALQRASESRRNAIFLDNPGGTQVAQQTIDRMTRYMIETNANHGVVLPPATLRML